jgi:nickel superoxide dismutase
MRIRLIALLSGIVLAGSVGSLWAHCEIPCGIYGDELRFSSIQEDITTIEKSMKMFTQLTGATDGDAAQNQNQLARWVANKETHAGRIQEVVTQYFMTQRLKVPAETEGPAFEAYSKKLVLLHKMLRTAMKCKQSVDLTHTMALHDLTHAFQEAYNAK